MIRNRVMLSFLLSMTMGGCALTAAQQAALSNLLSSAGLQTQLTDSAGNPLSLTSSQISSVSYNGKTLSPSQYAVNASGSIIFKNVVKENAGKVPVSIKLANGQVLNYQYDTSPSSIGDNRAVFVPGDDGQYHAAASGEDAQQAWQALHQADQQKHWLTVDLGLTDVPLASPSAILMAVRPGGAVAQTGWEVQLPNVFYSVDASGDVSFDAQALNLAAAAPPVGFAVPTGYQPPAPAPTPSPSPSTNTTTTTTQDLPDGTSDAPPALVTADQVKAATFVLLYPSTATQQISAVEFKIIGAVQVPNLDDHTLPPAQNFPVGAFSVVATASYSDIKSAVTAEGMLPVPPPPPSGPLLEAAPVSAFAQTQPAN